MITISANGVTLPSPTELTTGDEIIWSANTGRSTTGMMIGDVIAQKKTFNIKWGVLTLAQFNAIKQNILSGFHAFTLTLDNSPVTVTSYRGTLTGELLGTFGGETYYKSANVSVIQQ